MVRDSEWTILIPFRFVLRRITCDAMNIFNLFLYRIRDLFAEINVLNLRALNTEIHGPDRDRIHGPNRDQISPYLELK